MRRIHSTSQVHRIASRLGLVTISPPGFQRSRPWIVVDCVEEFVVGSLSGVRARCTQHFALSAHLLLLEPVGPRALHTRQQTHSLCTVTGGALRLWASHSSGQARSSHSPASGLQYHATEREPHAPTHVAERNEHNERERKQTKKATRIT